MRSKFLIFLTAAGLLLSAALGAEAGINLNIGINLSPPAYVIHEAPPVAVIPGSYVYFVPGIRVDILFYHGYWYRPYEGRWYRGRNYNGPWHHVVTRSVPYAILHLRPAYRHSGNYYRPIPYARMKKNWRRWEREKYWDRHEVRQERRMRHDETSHSQWEHDGHYDHRRGKDHDD